MIIQKLMLTESTITYGNAVTFIDTGIIHLRPFFRRLS